MMNKGPSKGSIHQHKDHAFKIQTLVLVCVAHILCVCLVPCACYCTECVPAVLGAVVALVVTMPPHHLVRGRVRVRG